MPPDSKAIGSRDGAYVYDNDRGEIIYVIGPVEEHIQQDRDQITLGGWARGLTADVDHAANSFRGWASGPEVQGDPDKILDIEFSLTLREARALAEFLLARIPETALPPEEPLPPIKKPKPEEPTP